MIQWAEVVLVKLTRMLVTLLVLTAWQGVVSGAECGHPGEPAGGTVASTEILFYPGEEVTYTCQDGYMLAGPARRRCQEDGTWTATLPSCSE